MGAAPESKQGRGEPLAREGLARNGPTDVKPQRGGTHSQTEGGGNFHRALEGLIKPSLKEGSSDCQHLNYKDRMQLKNYLLLSCEMVTAHQTL